MCNYRILQIEQPVVEHLGEPPETLGPDEGHIFIRQSLLATGIGLFGLDAGSGNIVWSPWRSRFVADSLDMAILCQRLRSEVAYLSRYWQSQGFPTLVVPLGRRHSAAGQLRLQAVRPPLRRRRSPVLRNN